MDTKMRILIVDDFPMLISVLRKILSDLGFKHVAEAHTGQQAMNLLLGAQIEQSPYGVVFADWYMPEMSGLELLEKCRDHADLKSTAIVMISAEREKSNMSRALQAGAFDYIMKPLGEEALAAKVKDILSRIHQHAKAS